LELFPLENQNIEQLTEQESYTISFIKCRNGGNTEIAKRFVQT
jgi:hypothetical protein